MRVFRNRIFLAGVVAVFILATVLSSLPIHVQGQNQTAFLSTERFTIPELNGSIRFALNGSYSSAKLEGDSWVFSDLALNNSRRLGNLRVSVQDSNITIYSFVSSNAVSTTRQSVRYYAEGAGRQVFDLGVNGTTHHSEWWVTISLPNTVFLAQGREWLLQPDNTVTVTGQTGNVSVTHFNFSGAQDNGNLPFEQQHSLLLATAALLAVTVVVAGIISIKVQRKRNGN